MVYSLNRRGSHLLCIVCDRVFCCPVLLWTRYIAKDDLDLYPPTSTSHVSVTVSSFSPTFWFSNFWTLCECVGGGEQNRNHLGDFIYAYPWQTSCTGKEKSRHKVVFTFMLILGERLLCGSVMGWYWLLHYFLTASMAACKDSVARRGSSC